MFKLPILRVRVSARTSHAFANNPNTSIAKTAATAKILRMSERRVIGTALWSDRDIVERCCERGNDATRARPRQTRRSEPLYSLSLRD
jgi:hypothetical protein